VTSTPPVLRKLQARRIWLHAQRLDSDAPFGGGPDATPAAVRHLGYVQIDTINVIERCHHHILFTRIPEYRREHLHLAQRASKTVFEYWTHALAYVPTDDFQYFVRDMRSYVDRSPRWFATVSEADVRSVVARIRRKGPLSIRDVDEDELVEKDHPWASRKPTKRVLQYAFYRGLLTISQRSGMVKTYELTTRHFGWKRLPAGASERKVGEYLLDRALRSQGVVSLESACYLDAPWKPWVRKAVESRVRRKEVVEVRVEGDAKTRHWATPETLESKFDASDTTHILSPFDPLVAQRKRLNLFFDYEHRFEAYLPKEKRVFGYFACPVVVGDEVVAALDLKADRGAKKLLIQKWTWVGKGKAREHKKKIEKALEAFEEFQLTPLSPSSEVLQPRADPHAPA
jgi:hypothetical protein